MAAISTDIETFVMKFSEQFEDEAAGSIHADTEFRGLEQWSSMQALVVTASFDWEYGVTLSAEELQAARTVRDLYERVVAKQAS
jgi:acyl carrier protein